MTLLSINSLYSDICCGLTLLCNHHGDGSYDITTLIGRCPYFDLLYLVLMGLHHAYTLTFTFTHTHTHTHSHNTHTHVHAHTNTHTLSVQLAGIGHSDVLKELTVTIRNSRLINTLLCELDTQNTATEKMDFLALSAT